MQFYCMGTILSLRLAMWVGRLEGQLSEGVLMSKRVELVLWIVALLIMLAPAVVAVVEADSECFTDTCVGCVDDCN